MAIMDTELDPGLRGRILELASELERTSAAYVEPIRRTMLQAAKDIREVLESPVLPPPPL